MADGLVAGWLLWQDATTNAMLHTTNRDGGCAAVRGGRNNIEGIDFDNG